MLHNQLQLQTIKINQLDEISNLSAAAFFDNPAHVYICSNSTKRYAQLKWLLGANLRLNLNHGAECFCLSSVDSVHAFGFWTKPNQKSISLKTKVAAGLLKTPFIIGWGNFRKMINISDLLEKHLSEEFKDKSYYYLNNFVVDKKLRGNGLGSKVLVQELERIRAISDNPIFALSNQRKENLAFYGRLGFEVIREEEMGKGQNKFINWIMVTK